MRPFLQVLSCGTRPGRVRFFKFYRVGRVRDASSAIPPSVLCTGPRRMRWQWLWQWRGTVRQTRAPAGASAVHHVFFFFLSVPYKAH
eukprot:gene8147-biopygen4612